MKIYSKILLTILPVTFLNFLVAAGTTYFFSQQAIFEHAEAWLTSKLNEAILIAEEQSNLINTYGLSAIPASVAKAKIDARKAIGQIKVREFGYIFAVDDKGTYVLHPDRSKLGRSAGSAEWYVQVSSGNAPFIGLIENEKHLVVSEVFQPWNWRIIAVDPEREVYLTINRVKPYLVLFGFSGAMLLIFVLMLVIHMIIKPLLSVTKGVEQMSLGDLSIRIPSKTGDEIGRLAQGFNAMAERIYSSHQELEQRVEERTRELVQANEVLRQSIEEKERAVEAWKSNERRIAAILRASPIGIGLVLDRKISWANDALYSILAYDKETLLNHNTRILYLSQDDYVRFGQMLDKDLEPGEVERAEVKLMRGDGRIIDGSVQACHLDPEDHTQGIIFALQDITAAKMMEEKLQRARKMEAIGTLAGGVAHDLNNILSGIVSYPELLLLELDEDSPLVPPLRTIKQSGERAAAIVQDLLTMARRGVAVEETVNLNNIIRELLTGPEMRQLLDSHPGVQVIDELEDSDIILSGSETHLAKCILNLLSNGVESIVDGGEVRIRTENILLEGQYRGYELIPSGEYVLLSIEDNGMGIPLSDVERIFEPFFTSKRMGRSGTGLGMSVVWGTVKDHQGFIDVISQENGGTVFKLFFPCTDIPESKKKIPESVSNLKGGGQRILVVDDSELQREIAYKILEKLGYSVFTVDSGEAAVSFLKEHDADLVILDMIMPGGMDGLDTYHAVYELNPQQKIIIVSGFSETGRVRDIQKQSGCTYLKKPYTIERLGKAILETVKVPAEEQRD